MLAAKPTSLNHPACLPRLALVVAVVLGTANAIGYTKCSKDAQARISSFARTTLINSILHRFV